MNGFGPVERHAQNLVNVKKQMKEFVTGAGTTLITQKMTLSKVIDFVDFVEISKTNASIIFPIVGETKASSP